MGTVWRAVDLTTGAPVALKLFRAEDAAQAARFSREAHVLASLSHPSIVRYIAHGAAENGDCFLAMEWLEGRRLDDDLGGGVAPPGECIPLAVGIADALGSAHAHGVVHRDVKPSNIMLVDNPKRAVLIDFGIARHSTAVPALTATGIVMGTPGYMAPEQAHGSPDVDLRADVFSLGCVFYQCLTGRPPFTGNDALSVLLKSVIETPEHVCEVRPELPWELGDLVMRMLSKSPAARPADGIAVAAELRAIQERCAKGGGAGGWVQHRALSARELAVRSIAVVARKSIGGVPAGQTPETLVLPPIQHVFEIAQAARCSAEVLADGVMIFSPVEARSAADGALAVCRAALSLRTTLPPSVSVAVVTGRTDAAVGAPVGEVLESAAALIQRAVEGTIAVDEGTVRLIGDRLLTRWSRGIAILVRERDESERPATLLGRETPFTGREHDLRALMAAVDETVNEPFGRAVLLVGEAGMGKSRLFNEMVLAIARERPSVRVLGGRADPLQSDVPFALLARILRRSGGITRGDLASERQRKLLSLVGAVPAAERQRVAAFLGETLGAQFPDEELPELRRARGRATSIAEQITYAFRTFLHAECARRPVIIAIDDADSGDPPSVRAIDAVLRAMRQERLLVIGFASPDVDTRFPGLWRGRGLVRREIQPLPDAAARQIAQSALGEEVPAHELDRIVEQSAGNVLCLEELVRTHREGRAEEVPASVHAIVQARLKSVPADVRRVLRAASVLGVEFCEEGVRRLLGQESSADVWTSLCGAAAAELVDPLRRSSCTHCASECKHLTPSQPGAECDRRFRFRHGLLRAACHHSLIEADRLVGHLRAAAWFSAADRVDAAVVARHYEQGGAPAEAIPWLLRATTAAMNASDFATALALAGRGLEAGAGDVTRGELLRYEAEALGWLGRTSEMAAAATEALALLPRGSAGWCAALVQASMAAGRLGHGEIAVDLARQIHDRLDAGDISPDVLLAAAHVAEHLSVSNIGEQASRLLDRIQAVIAQQDQPDAAVETRLLLARSHRAHRAGERGPALSFASLAVSRADRAGDVRLELRAKLARGLGLLLTGQNREATREFEEQLRVAEGLFLPTGATEARRNLMLLLLRRRAWTEALRLGSVVEAAYRGASNPRMIGAVNVYLALAHLGAGDLDAAEERARDVTQNEALDAGLTAHAHAVLARVLAARGETAAALAAAEEGVRRLESGRAFETDEMFIRLALVLALAAMGDERRSREQLEIAHDSLMKACATIEEGAVRERFLREIPEHAEILRLHDAPPGTVASGDALAPLAAGPLAQNAD